MNTKLLNEIKITTEKWNGPMYLKRRDEVVLNRLRIGHTHYTSAHIMKKEPTRTYVIHVNIQPKTSLQNVRHSRGPTKIQHT